MAKQSFFAQQPVRMTRPQKQFVAYLTAMSSQDSSRKQTHRQPHHHLSLLSLFFFGGSKRLPGVPNQALQADGHWLQPHSFHPQLHVADCSPTPPQLALGLDTLAQFLGTEERL